MVDQMQAALLDDPPPSEAAVDLPNLRRLRDRSVQFTSAYCPAPVCTPTRASLQLGQQVWRHGVIGNDRSMPAESATFADRLNDAGYTTGYVGKWHLDRDSSRGWQAFDTARAAWRDRFADRGVKPDSGASVMRGIDAPHAGAAPYGEELHIDGVVRDLARDELARLADGGRPFALMASFYGPHAPYYVPEPWLDPSLADLPLPDSFDDPMTDKPAIQRAFRCRAWGETWSEAKWRRIRAAYFSYARMLDHFVGQLLAALDATGRGGETAVAFFSDHGEMNGHHRMIYKGPMMYDPIVRVPLLLHVPGRGGGRVEGFAKLEDVPVTLLSAVGAEPLADADGVDLWPALSSGPLDAIGRPHVASEFHEANWGAPVVRQRVAMLRTATHKYVLTEGQGEELYDLRSGLAETENLAALPAGRDVVRSIRTGLAREIPWTADAAP